MEFVQSDELLSARPTLRLVHLTRVQLSNVRSWAELTLDLTPGVTLISGANAAGKSNLVEAIYMLAALRSTRAQTEGEVIRWSAPKPQVARVAGTALKAGEQVEVEVALSAREGGSASSARQRSGAPLTSKRIRVNGVARRAADALGAIRAVQFTSLDIELLTGSSGLRRRFLDVAVGQLVPTHAAGLSRYQRALTQRNALLKRIAEGRARESELDQWDDLLSAAAAPIWEARAAAAHALSAHAREQHRSLRAPDDPAETIALTYLPADRPTLRESRRRDLARGTTSVGPHRDDLLIDLDERPAANFASRAQQRAVALSLRLAEAEYLRSQGDDPPILLLDDIFSELDPVRRERTAAAVSTMEQVILTSADPAAAALNRSEIAASYQIDDGRMRPLLD
ncbi:MAG: DNA replication/repair protein RecF [Chloroflexi bacterium]|nr:DNA replication/repair protein RecF [Chloroflexota bacterium]MYF21791.1 DNA replication/repair protein RecF [Chloroflexota bacterium]